MFRRLRACPTAPRPRDDRGQVLSSLVAVAAVVAIVAGLLVLFGTRGNDSKADEPSGARTPKPSANRSPSNWTPRASGRRAAAARSTRRSSSRCSTAAA